MTKNLKQDLIPRYPASRPTTNYCLRSRSLSLLRLYSCFWLIMSPLLWKGETYCICSYSYSTSTSSSSYYSSGNFLSGAELTNYLKELIETWNIDRWRCEVVHLARVITLGHFVAELSPLFQYFNGVLCPEQNSETTWRNWWKLGI